MAGNRPPWLEHRHMTISEHRAASRSLGTCWHRPIAFGRQGGVSSCASYSLGVIVRNHILDVQEAQFIAQPLFKAQITHPVSVFGFGWMMSSALFGRIKALALAARMLLASFRSRAPVLAFAVAVASLILSCGTTRQVGMTRRLGLVWPTSQCLEDT